MSSAALIIGLTLLANIHFGWLVIQATMAAHTHKRYNHGLTRITSAINLTTALM